MHVRGFSGTENSKWIKECVVPGLRIQSPLVALRRFGGLIWTFTGFA